MHLLRRLPDNPDVVIADADDVPGNRTKDVYAMSGADAKVSIGESFLPSFWLYAGLSALDCGRSIYLMNSIKQNDTHPLIRLSTPQTVLS